MPYVSESRPAGVSENVLPLWLQSSRTAWEYLRDQNLRATDTADTAQVSDGGPEQVAAECDRGFLVDWDLAGRVGKRGEEAVSGVGDGVGPPSSGL